jgi:nitroimidazol reductase NimA-like FMN-containing flavoprotein (pyridoxamine 5'-phosphate oxidase superfamily)
MPSRRAQIRMTRAEEVAFLQKQAFGVLGTTGPQGHPHLVTMGFALDGPDTVVMTSFPTAQKVANAERSPAASFLVERTGAYHEIRGVLLRGQIEVSPDPPTVARCYQLVKEHSTRLLDASDLPEVDDDALIGKRVALVLTVTHRVTWDHEKLDGTY